MSPPTVTQHLTQRVRLRRSGSRVVARGGEDEEEEEEETEHFVGLTSPYGGQETGRERVHSGSLPSRRGYRQCVRGVLKTPSENVLRSVQRCKHVLMDEHRWINTITTHLQGVKFEREKENAKNSSLINETEDGSGM